MRKKARKTVRTTARKTKSRVKAKARTKARTVRKTLRTKTKRATKTVRITDRSRAKTLETMLAQTSKDVGILLGGFDHLLEHSTLATDGDETIINIPTRRMAEITTHIESFLKTRCERTHLEVMPLYTKLNRINTTQFKGVDLTQQAPTNADTTQPQVP